MKLERLSVILILSVSMMFAIGCGESGPQVIKGGGDGVIDPADIPEDDPYDNLEAE